MAELELTCLARSIQQREWDKMKQNQDLPTSPTSLSSAHKMNCHGAIMRIEKLKKVEIELAFNICAYGFGESDLFSEMLAVCSKLPEGRRLVPETYLYSENGCAKSGRPTA
jgi:hypothetical protein